jgi:hypothetical protein
VTKDALQTVLDKIRALSPEEFQQELHKHRYTELALSFRELQEFGEYLNNGAVDDTKN